MTMNTIKILVSSLLD